MAVLYGREHPGKRGPVTEDLHVGERPLPTPDATSAPFWSAGADGRLLYQQCGTCGANQFYPRPVCISCGATPVWSTASGRGSVHSFTIIRQNHAPPFRDLVPYVVAMIEIDEGVRIMGNIVGCEPESVAVGSSVEVFFRPAAEDVFLPFWQLATESSVD